MIRSVVFDVGETLLDDTREWGRWADWIGIPRHTFSAVLGAVTAAGRNNAETFSTFDQASTSPSSGNGVKRRGPGEQIAEDDLYPDVRTSLTALRDAGIRVGIAGNQTARAADLLRGLNLPADAIATSGRQPISTCVDSQE